MKNAIRTYTCVGCGIKVTKSCTKKVKFCTPDCYHKHGKTGRKKTGKTINCAVCNSPFYVTKSRIGKAVCCSVSCQQKWQSKKIKTTCETCNKEYEVSPSRFKFDNPRFCSIDCRNNNESVRQHLIKMNQIQQSKSMTSIEKIGYQILRDNKVEFIPQKLLFNKFCVDAFIPSKNTVVQFDGDYWHGNPAKYKTLDKRQSKRVSLDKSQDKYMKKCGIRVVRIWGSELKSNPEKLIELI